MLEKEYNPHGDYPTVPLESAPEVEAIINEEQLSKLKLNGEADILTNVVANDLEVGGNLKLRSEISGDTYAVEILDIEEKGGMKITPNLLNVKYDSGDYANSETGIKVKLIGPIEKGSWQNESE